MEAAKNNPQFAKKVGVPQSVAREFVAADERQEAKMGKREMAGKKPIPQKLTRTPTHGYGR
jgi:hypothetical protein